MPGFHPFIPKQALWWLSLSPGLSHTAPLSSTDTHRSCFSAQALYKGVALTLLCFQRGRGFLIFPREIQRVLTHTHVLTPAVVFAVLCMQFLLSQLCLRQQPRQIQARGAAVTWSDKHRHALFAHSPRTNTDCMPVLSETNRFSRTGSLKSAQSYLNSTCM